MAFAFPENIIHRLLKQLDAEPRPIFSGAALADCPANILDSLLEARLLTELASLDELASCDCPIDGCCRIIQRDGTKVWAFCANGSAAPLEMNPQHLRQFKLELPTFYQKLREENKLDGDAITEFTHTVCFLGCMQVGERRVPVVLARCLRPSLAESVLFEIRGRINEKPVIILTPTPRSFDLHILHHFQADGLMLAVMSNLMVSPGRLALDSQKIESLLRPTVPVSSKEVILRLDIKKSLCYFRDIPVNLTKMPFDVLVLLAQEALAGPGWVSRDRIFECCWSEDWERGISPNEEQITKMVSEVRNTIRNKGKLSPAEARQLVETKSKIGYRLNLKPDEIELL